MTPEFELFYTRHLAGVEGGEVDHNLDKGGATWYGISTGFLNDIGRKGPISKADAKQITFEYFWDAGGCQEMDQVAAWCYCDALFNHSPKAAGRMLQHGLQVAVDGIVGPATKEAAREINRKLFIDRYRVYRNRYYIDLVRKDSEQIVFLLGWIDRVHRLTQSMLISGLFESDLKKLKWYSPDNYSVSTKATGLAGITFGSVIALFWPNIDLTSIDSFVDDPETLKAGLISVGAWFLAKWRTR